MGGDNIYLRVSVGLVGWEPEPKASSLEAEPAAKASISLQKFWPEG